MALATQRQLLNHRANIAAIGADMKNARATHAVEWLENHIAVLGMKGAQYIITARHNRRRAALGKLLGKELLITLQQRSSGVDHQHALALGKAQ